MKIITQSIEVSQPNNFYKILAHKEDLPGAIADAIN